MKHILALLCAVRAITYGKDFKITQLLNEKIETNKGIVIQ